MIKAVERRFVWAALLAGVGLLCALGTAFLLINHQITGLIGAQITTELSRDRLMIETIHRQRGQDGVARVIPKMLAIDEGKRNLLYVGPDGSTLAGNLDLWPSTLDSDDSAVSLEIDDQYMHVVTARFDDGSRLLIGESHDRAPILTRSGMLAALTALGIMLFAGLAVGMQFQRYLIERIGAVVATAREIMRGQIHARVPDSGATGPFSQMSHALNDMLDQNEALVTGLRTVTDSLAHDLRTPLMRMGGAIAEARGEPDARARAVALDRAELESRHVLETFSSLIDIARAESGLSRETMESVDLRELAQDAADLFEPVAVDCGRRLVRRFEPARAFAHRQILFQAICNLLENALRHAPPDGEVLLALEAGQGTQGPRFTVMDRGPGIPAAARGRALERFNGLSAGGADGARARSARGNGLGLSIAAAAARLHGGRMLLEDAAPGLMARIALAPPPQATPRPELRSRGREFWLRFGWAR
jgi:signal transduction histidine kinase